MTKNKFNKTASFNQTTAMSKLLHKESYERSLPASSEKKAINSAIEYIYEQITPKDNKKPNETALEDYSIFDKEETFSIENPMRQNKKPPLLSEIFPKTTEFSYEISKQEKSILKKSEAQRKLKKLAKEAEISDKAKEKFIFENDLSRIKSPKPISRESKKIEQKQRAH